MKGPILIAALLTCAPSSIEAALPKFSAYHVNEAFRSAPARAVIQTVEARRFRTRIVEGAKSGPNFAGYFAIVEWGCGVSCVSFALVNERSGQVFSAPFRTLDYSGSVKYADGSWSLGSNFQPLTFRKDSRLLMVRGCPDTDYRKGCALFYYEWKDDHFLPVTKIRGVEVPFE